jgi:hypothetical protein
MKESRSLGLVAILAGRRPFSFVRSVRGARDICMALGRASSVGSAIVLDMHRLLKAKQTGHCERSGNCEQASGQGRV